MTEMNPAQHEVCRAIDLLMKGGAHNEMVVAGHALQRWWLRDKEPAKVECPNCLKPVGPGWDHEASPQQFTCNPAQPEPAAPSEMPEAVQEAVGRLKSEGWDDSAEVVLYLWRAQASQPVKL